MLTNKPLLMGVINITPDSFSDGGECFSPKDALRRSAALLHSGADVLDIGAESTRPNAHPVSPDEEWRRLAPILAELSAQGLSEKISVDTRHEATALRACGEYGIGWVNNIAGLYSTHGLAQLARFNDLRYIAMHMHGNPETMQQTPLMGSDAIVTVDRAFAQYHQYLSQAGFSRERIYLDPGIGFGKDDSGNLKLIGHLSHWTPNYQVAVGVSRKSFIGRLTNIALAKDRDGASKMLEFGVMLAGASVIRTHDAEMLAKVLNLYFE